MSRPIQKAIRAQSPGRINIIGEHTDYNEGYVLPAAIDRYTIFNLSLSGSEETCTVKALNPDEEYSFKLSALQPLPGGWQNYVMGVVSELIQAGCRLSGFKASFCGDVPIGAGLSSSAALECALVKGLNELFDLGLTDWQMIRIAQRAEHHFVGMKCGIMDQFASIMGKENQAMLLDCRSLEFRYFPLDTEPYRFLLLDSHVEHELANSEYNVRRSECHQGLHIIKESFEQVESLRNVTPIMLQSCKPRMDKKVFGRCKHVITENERVLQATRAMESGDFKTLGQLIYDSHSSLQYDYEVSCPEIDFLVDFTREKTYITGSRIMGGGFGGCTINLIHQEYVDRFVEEVSTDYEDKFGMTPTAYQVSAADGANIIS